MEPDDTSIEACITDVMPKPLEVPESTPGMPGKVEPMPLSDYMRRLQALTAIDFLLIVFAVCIILGFIMTFSASMAEYAPSLIRLGFLGVVAFITISGMNQKVVADICTTCQGMHPMKFDRKIDVILSFVWANIQTFIALILNVLYFFLVLFVVYLCLRSHLLYRYGDSTGMFAPYSDGRIMSRLHSSMAYAPKSVTIALIYWIIMIVSILLVCLLVSVAIADQITRATTGKSKPVIEKMLKVLKQWGVLGMPFLFSAATLLFQFFSHRAGTNIINEVIARRIIPAISFQTVTSGFNFLHKETMKTHALAFGTVIIFAVLYATMFLNPFAKADVCTEEPSASPTSPAFISFKNHFVLGHYLLGLVLVMIYLALMGGKIGRYLIIITLGTLAVVYILTYLAAAQGQGQREESEDE